MQFQNLDSAQRISQTYTSVTQWSLNDVLLQCIDPVVKGTEQNNTQGQLPQIPYEIVLYLADNIDSNDQLFDFSQAPATSTDTKSIIIIGNQAQTIKISVDHYSVLERLELRNVNVMDSVIVKREGMTLIINDCVFKGNNSLDLVIANSPSVDPITSEITNDLIVSHTTFENDFDTNLFKPYVRVLNKSKTFNDIASNSLGAAQWFFYSCIFKNIYKPVFDITVDNNVNGASYDNINLFWSINNIIFDNVCGNCFRIEGIRTEFINVQMINCSNQHLAKFDQGQELIMNNPDPTTIKSLNTVPGLGHSRFDNSHAEYNDTEYEVARTNDKMTKEVYMQLINKRTDIDYAYDSLRVLSNSNRLSLSMQTNLPREQTQGQLYDALAHRQTQRLGNKCFLLFPIMQGSATQDQISNNKQQTLQYYLQIDNQLSFLKEITFDADNVPNLPIFCFSQDTLTAAQQNTLLTRVKNLTLSLAAATQDAISNTSIAGSLDGAFDVALSGAANYEIVRVTQDQISSIVKMQQNDLPHSIGIHVDSDIKYNLTVQGFAHIMLDLQGGAEQVISLKCITTPQSEPMLRKSLTIAMPGISSNTQTITQVELVSAFNVLSSQQYNPARDIFSISQLASYGHVQRMPSSGQNPYLESGLVFCGQADEEWIFPTEFSRLANEMLLSQSDLSFLNPKTFQFSIDLGCKREANVQALQIGDNSDDVSVPNILHRYKKTTALNSVSDTLCAVAVIGCVDQKIRGALTQFQTFNVECTQVSTAQGATPGVTSQFQPYGVQSIVFQEEQRSFSLPTYNISCEVLRSFKQRIFPALRDVDVMTFAGVAFKEQVLSNVNLKLHDHITVSQAQSISVDIGCARMNNSYIENAFLPIFTNKAITISATNNNATTINGSYVANMIIKKKNVFQPMIDEVNYGIQTQGLGYASLHTVTDTPFFWRPIAGVYLPESVTGNLYDNTNTQCGTVIKNAGENGLITYTLTTGQTGQILDRFDSMNVFQFTITNEGTSPQDITGFRMDFASGFNTDSLAHQTHLKNKVIPGFRPFLILSSNEYDIMKTSQRVKSTNAKSTLLRSLKLYKQNALNISDVDNTFSNNSYGVCVLDQFLQHPNNKLTNVSKGFRPYLYTQVEVLFIDEDETSKASAMQAFNADALMVQGFSTAMLAFALGDSNPLSQTVVANYYQDQYKLCYYLMHAVVAQGGMTQGNGVTQSETSDAIDVTFNLLSTKGWSATVQNDRATASSTTVDTDLDPNYVPQYFNVTAQARGVYDYSTLMIKSTNGDTMLNYAINSQDVTLIETMGQSQIQGAFPNVLSSKFYSNSVNIFHEPLMMKQCVNVMLHSDAQFIFYQIGQIQSVIFPLIEILALPIQDSTIYSDNTVSATFSFKDDRSLQQLKRLEQYCNNIAMPAAIQSRRLRTTNGVVAKTLCMTYSALKINPDPTVSFTDDETGLTAYTRMSQALCFTISQPYSDMTTTNPDVLHRIGQVIFKDKLIHERWQCSSAYYDCSDVIEALPLPNVLSGTPKDFYQNLAVQAKLFYVNTGLVLDLALDGGLQQSFFGYKHAHLQDRPTFARSIQLAKESGDTSATGASAQIFLSLQSAQMKKFSWAAQRMFKNTLFFSHVTPGVTLTLNTISVTRNANTDPTIGTISQPAVVLPLGVKMTNSLDIQTQIFSDQYNNSVIAQFGAAAQVIFYGDNTMPAITQTQLDSQQDIETLRNSAYADGGADASIYADASLCVDLRCINVDYAATSAFNLFVKNTQLLLHNLNYQQIAIAVRGDSQILCCASLTVLSNGANASFLGQFAVQQLVCDDLIYHERKMIFSGIVPQSCDVHSIQHKDNIIGGFNTVIPRTIRGAYDTDYQNIPANIDHFLGRKPQSVSFYVGSCDGVLIASGAQVNNGASRLLSLNLVQFAMTIDDSDTLQLPQVSIADIKNDTILAQKPYQDTNVQMYNSLGVLSQNNVANQNYVNCTGASVADLINNNIRGNEFFAYASIPSLSISIRERISFNDLCQIKLKMRIFADCQIRIRIVASHDVLGGASECSTSIEKVSPFQTLAATGIDTITFDLGLVSPSIGLGSTSFSGVLYVDKIVIDVQNVDTFRLQELYGFQNTFQSATFAADNAFQLCLLSTITLVLGNRERIYTNFSSKYLQALLSFKGCGLALNPFEEIHSANGTVIGGDLLSIYYSEAQNIKLYERSMTSNGVRILEQEEKDRRRIKNNHSPHFISKLVYLQHTLNKGGIDLDNVSKNYSGLRDYQIMLRVDKASLLKKIRNGEQVALPQIRFTGRTNISFAGVEPTSSQQDKIITIETAQRVLTEQEAYGLIASLGNSIGSGYTLGVSGNSNILYLRSGVSSQLALENVHIDIIESISLVTKENTLDFELVQFNIDDVSLVFQQHFNAQQMPSASSFFTIGNNGAQSNIVTSFFNKRINYSSCSTQICTNALIVPPTHLYGTKIVFTAPQRQVIDYEANNNYGLANHDRFIVTTSYSKGADDKYYQLLGQTQRIINTQEQPILIMGTPNERSAFNSRGYHIISNLYAKRGSTTVLKNDKSCTIFYRDAQDVLPFIAWPMNNTLTYGRNSLDSQDGWYNMQSTTDTGLFTRFYNVGVNDNNRYYLLSFPVSIAYDYYINTLFDQHLPWNTSITDMQNALSYLNLTNVVDFDYLRLNAGVPQVTWSASADVSLNYKLSFLLEMQNSSEIQFKNIVSKLKEQKVELLTHEVVQIIASYARQYTMDTQGNQNSNVAVYCNQRFLQQGQNNKNSRFIFKNAIFIDCVFQIDNVSTKSRELRFQFDNCIIFNRPIISKPLTANYDAATSSGDFSTFLINETTLSTLPGWVSGSSDISTLQQSSDSFIVINNNVVQPPGRSMFPIKVSCSFDSSIVYNPNSNNQQLRSSLSTAQNTSFTPLISTTKSDITLELVDSLINWCTLCDNTQGTQRLHLEAQNNIFQGYVGEPYLNHYSLIDNNLFLGCDNPQLQMNTLLQTGKILVNKVINMSALSLAIGFRPSGDDPAIQIGNVQFFTVDENGERIINVNVPPLAGAGQNNELIAQRIFYPNVASYMNAPGITLPAGVTNLLEIQEDYQLVKYLYISAQATMTAAQWQDLVQRIQYVQVLDFYTPYIGLNIDLSDDNVNGSGADIAITQSIVDVPIVYGIYNSFAAITTSVIPAPIPYNQRVINWTKKSMADVNTMIQGQPNMGYIFYGARQGNHIFTNNVILSANGFIIQEHGVLTQFLTIDKKPVSLQISDNMCDGPMSFIIGDTVFPATSGSVLPGGIQSPGAPEAQVTQIMKKRLIYNNYETLDRGINLYQIEKIYLESGILPNIVTKSIDVNNLNAGTMIYNTTATIVIGGNPNTSGVILALATFGKKYYFSEMLDISVALQCDWTVERANILNHIFYDTSLQNTARALISQYKSGQCLMIFVNDSNAMRFRYQDAQTIFYIYRQKKIQTFVNYFKGWHTYLNLQANVKAGQDCVNVCTIPNMFAPALGNIQLLQKFKLFVYDNIVSYTQVNIAAQGSTAAATQTIQTRTGILQRFGTEVQLNINYVSQNKQLFYNEILLEPLQAVGAGDQYLLYTDLPDNETVFNQITIQNKQVDRLTYIGNGTMGLSQMMVDDSADLITALQEVKDNGQIGLRSKIYLTQRIKLLRRTTLIIKSLEQKEILQLKIDADAAHLVFVDCIFQNNLQIRAKQLTFVNCQFYELGKIDQAEYSTAVQNEFSGDGFYAIMSRDSCSFENCLFFECAVKLQSSYDPFKSGQYRFMDVANTNSVYAPYENNSTIVSVDPAKRVCNVNNCMFVGNYSKLFSANTSLRITQCNIQYQGDSVCESSKYNQQGGVDPDSQSLVLQDNFFHFDKRDYDNQNIVQAAQFRECLAAPIQFSQALNTQLGTQLTFATDYTTQTTPLRYGDYLDVRFKNLVSAQMRVDFIMENVYEVQDNTNPLIWERKTEQKIVTFLVPTIGDYQLIIQSNGSTPLTGAAGYQQLTTILSQSFTPTVVGNITRRDAGINMNKMQVVFTPINIIVQSAQNLSNLMVLRQLNSFVNLDTGLESATSTTLQVDFNDKDTYSVVSVGGGTNNKGILNRNSVTVFDFNNDSGFVAQQAQWIYPYDNFVKYSRKYITGTYNQFFMFLESESSLVQSSTIIVGGQPQQVTYSILDDWVYLSQQFKGYRPLLFSNNPRNPLFGSESGVDALLIQEGITGRELAYARNGYRSNLLQNGANYKKILIYYSQGLDYLDTFFADRDLSEYYIIKFIDDPILFTASLRKYTILEMKLEAGFTGDISGSGVTNGNTLFNVENISSSKQTMQIENIYYANSDASVPVSEVPLYEVKILEQNARAGSNTCFILSNKHDLIKIKNNIIVQPQASVFIFNNMQKMKTGSGAAGVVNNDDLVNIEDLTIEYTTDGQVPYTLFDIRYDVIDDTTVKTKLVTDGLFSQINCRNVRQRYTKEILDSNNVKHYVPVDDVVTRYEDYMIVAELTTNIIKRLDWWALMNFVDKRVPKLTAFSRDPHECFTWSIFSNISGVNVASQSIARGLVQKSTYINWFKQPDGQIWNGITLPGNTYSFSLVPMTTTGDYAQINVGDEAKIVQTMYRRSKDIIYVLIAPQSTDTRELKQSDIKGGAYSVALNLENLTQGQGEQSGNYFIKKISINGKTLSPSQYQLVNVDYQRNYSTITVNVANDATTQKSNFGVLKIELAH